MSDLSAFKANENEVHKHQKGAKVTREFTGLVKDLLDRSGFEIGEMHLGRVSLWESGAPGEEKDILTAVQLLPGVGSGPAWPVIQPGKPCIVRAPKLAAKKDTGFKTAVVLPDMQGGYFINAAAELEPTHDEAAMNVALQIVRFVRPDKIILNGDNLDLPEMSKYRLSPAYARTTQATIDRMTLFAAELRAAAGDECEIEWLEGNHEMRMSMYVLDNAGAAFGLKKGNQPDSWPVLSVPNLCDFDAHGIVYLPGYPASQTWINDRLRVIHGTHVKSGGSTAHQYLAHDRVSTVYGHIHRREWAERTEVGFGGGHRILAMSAGCLARCDGRVPSTKGGIDLDGQPVQNVEDWQQGVAVFQYEPGNGRFVPEQVPIDNGWTLYHGREFRAEVAA